MSATIMTITTTTTTNNNNAKPNTHIAMNVIRNMICSNIGNDIGSDIGSDIRHLSRGLLFTLFFTLLFAVTTQALAQTAQTISFATIANKAYSPTAFAVAPTTNAVGLTVTVTSATPTICTATGTDGKTVTMLTIGICTLNANQAGGSNTATPPVTYAAAPQVTKSFTITKANQTITFATIATKTYTSTLFTVAPTSNGSSAGVPFTVTVSSATPTICTATGTDGKTITILMVGTCTLNANQPGSAEYNAATQLSRSFSISKATQTITFAALATKTYSTTPFTVSATTTVAANAGTANLPVSFTSTTPTICTATDGSGNIAGVNGSLGSTITLLTVGNCTLNANQAGDPTTAAAAQIVRSFTISKATQTITFAAPAARAYSPTPFTVSATTAVAANAGTANLPVSFTSTTPTICTATDGSGNIAGVNGSLGSTITLLTVGTCTLNANQAGDPTTAAAAQIVRSFTISKAAQTITFAALPSRPVNAGSFTVAATASSTLTVAITSATPSVCTATAGTNSTTIATLTIGTCTLRANQAGDSKYNAATQVSQGLTVTTALPTQTITGFTSNPPTPITFSAAPTNTVTLTATGGASGNPVIFASTTPAVCTSSGSNGEIITIQTAGTCTVTANQAGNASFAPAPPITQNITINKAAQTITGFTPPASLSQGAGSTITLAASGGQSGNPVTFSSTTPTICTTTGTTASTVGATLTVIAAGTCTINADQAGNLNYAAAVTVTQSMAITTVAQVYYIHADHLGTPRVITKSDATNAKVWEWSNSDAFGANLPNEDPNGTGKNFKYNNRFMGQYYDQETGTMYNYFRDYDPATGRYVQSDPIGLKGGKNTYSYVEGRPLSFADPYGLLTVNIWDFRGSSEAWGHASITLDDGTHISWWPSPKGREGLLFPALPIYSAPPNENQTMQDDINMEEQNPSRQIVIKGLDENAIKNWWLTYKSKNKWKTLGPNCSTVTADALAVGGGSKFSILGGGLPVHFIWTPNNVKDYAESIQKGIERWNSLKEKFR